MLALGIVSLVALGLLVALIIVGTIRAKCDWTVLDVLLFILLMGLITIPTDYVSLTFSKLGS